VEAWLPAGAAVLLSADRFYPTSALFTWVQVRGWGDRLRLKGNVLADPGQGKEATTGQLAQGVSERYLSGVRLFAQGSMTNLGTLHEAGYPEPWIIALDGAPTRAAVLDYAARWAIEPMFSDFKGRGFDLGSSQLEPADHLERLVLVMALAMYGGGSRRPKRRRRPSDPARKKTREQSDPDHWSFRKLRRSLISRFTRGLRRLKRCLQNRLPLPPFGGPSQSDRW
jgi:hypothetical protein